MILQITGGFSGDSFDEPLFPLGTWCADANVRPVCTAGDLDAANDLPVDLESRRLVELLEDLVYPCLNSIHSRSYPAVFWRYTLGTYFRMLVPLLIQRHNLVKRARDLGGLRKYTKLEVSPELIVPDDRPSMLSIVNSHAWNQVVIGTICETLGLVPVNAVTDVVLHPPARFASRQLHPEKRGVTKLAITSVCNAIARRSDVLITQSMLPKRSELKLALRHRTLPYFWTEDFQYSDALDLSMRQKIQEIIPKTSGTDETILRLAVSLIPKVFVEDFEAAWKYLRKRLPRTPRQVFTSNLHQASDVFLIWLCAVRLQETAVIISQHGGVHSLCRDVSADIQSERDLADRYITWGAPTFASATALPGPILVNVATPRRSDTRFLVNSLLLVLDSPYRYPSVPRGMNGDRFSYASLLNDFIQQVDPDVVPRIEIRPYRGSEIWDDSLIDLLFHDSRIQFDEKFPPIQDLYNRSRLVVSTSLGTTFFQTIHQNIPTMILLDPTMSPISTMASTALNGIRQASILFDDVKQISRRVNERYKSIESWWTDSATTAGIRDFENRFSIKVADPIEFYKATISSTHFARSGR